MVDFGQSEILKQLIRDGIGAGRAGTQNVRGIENAGRSHDSAHPRVTPGEDTGDLNSGERDAGRNRRQFTGGDVKQIESPGLRLICNPNQVVRSMSGMPMRQTTQKPTRIAPRGVVSLMVIEGGKR